MKLSNTLQKIEIKRAMRVLPQYYLGAILLALLIGVVAVFGTVMGTKTEAKQSITIAFVMNSNKFLSSLGMQILTSARSTDGLCEFANVDEETAMEGLQNGLYTGVIIFPDHFVNAVLSDDDAKAEVYVPRFGNSFNDDLLRGLTDAGSELLSATEAGITAVAKFCTLEGTDKATTTAMDNEINALFAEHALSREDIFVKDTVSGTGNLTTIQYYACSVIVMLLLLGGISCGPFLKGDSRAYSNQLTHHGIGPVKQLLHKYTAVLVLFTTLYLTIFAVFVVAWIVKPRLVSEYLCLTSIGQLGTWFLIGIPIIFLAAAMVIFMYTFASNQIGGILLLFLVSVLMGYMSGCLVPSAYLPTSIRSLATYLPTTVMMNQMLNGIRLSITMSVLGWLVVQTVLWLGAAGLITKGRQVKEL